MCALCSFFTSYSVGDHNLRDATNLTLSPLLKFLRQQVRITKSTVLLSSTGLRAPLNFTSDVFDVLIIPAVCFVKGKCYTQQL